MIKNMSKQYRLFIAGIILPVFLFNLFFSSSDTSFQPNQESSGPVRIIYKALKETSLESYGIFGNELVFPFSSDIELLKVGRGMASSNDLARAKASGAFNYIYEDGEVQTELIAPSDPYFTLDPANENKQWYLPKIRVTDAWEFGRGSSEVVVAVVDTGIHAEHVELNDGRVIAGYNAISKTNIAANSNSDDNGHGTAVAGVIAATSDNDRGIAGINWNARLMPLKALSADGTGFISDVASAIVWAADNGAHIINLSMGGTGFAPDAALNDAIRHAFRKNAVIVAAAGNDNAENGANLDLNPVYPVCADGGENMVIGVGATDLSDIKTNFSNYGANCIDVMAPGKKILTTAYLPSDPSNNILIYSSGTSVASPIVSGIASLLKSNSPHLSNVQIRDIILKSADNIDAVNTAGCNGGSCSGLLGKGRVNAFFALSPQPILDNAFIQQGSTGKIYRITGGKKQYVSEFVFAQRGFDHSLVVLEFGSQLSSIPDTDPLPPLDGTLIKAASDPTVYYVHSGLRRPVTYTVFTTRNFRFIDVKTAPDADVGILKMGEWYWPPDGTMVIIKGDPTVYVMENEVKRPVTYFVFIQRKLSFSKVMNVTADEFRHIPSASDRYWLAPLEGTLVKSNSDPTVYVVSGRALRALSYEAFVRIGYSFSKIQTLPQAEIEVIAPGSPILN
jgi:subtilisin family serine protease